MSKCIITTSLEQEHNKVTHELERFRSTFEPEGYKSCHHASSHPQGKRTTEDPEEDAQRLEHGHDFKGVAVIPLGLIGHDGPVAMSQDHAITQHQ